MIEIRDVNNKLLLKVDAQNLSGANLREANLRRANLSGANLRGADLRGANLRRANLRGVNLRCADLRRAKLWGANLREANLGCADLSGANLRGAGLGGAELRWANLRRADLRGAELIGHSIVPEEGSFIGWKQLQAKLIAKLLIPDDAWRVGGLIGRKCRCKKATVLSITSADGEPRSIGFSDYNTDFIYRVGEEVHAGPEATPDVTVECAPGIHFYITRAEAEEHV